MKILLMLGCLLLAPLMVALQPAWAHKTRIFAYGDNDQIVGEAAFSGGKKAKNITVSIIDAETGSTLATGRTDDHGNFSIAIPEQAIKEQLDLLVVGDGGDGHRAQWLLEAAAYLTTGDTTAPGQSTGEVAPPAEHAAAETRPARQQCLTEQQFQKQLAQTLGTQLQPIKHILAQSQQRSMTLQDILGSIGYLIGVAGIISYFKSKKGANHG